MTTDEEAAKAVPLLGERVFTFTRRYRVVTTLTDEEIIERAQLFSLVTSAGFPGSVVEAIDLIIRIMTELKIGSPANISIVRHSSQIDEKDPGDF